MPQYNVMRKTFLFPCPNLLRPNLELPTFPNGNLSQLKILWRRCNLKRGPNQSLGLTCKWGWIATECRAYVPFLETCPISSPIPFLSRSRMGNWIYNRLSLQHSVIFCFYFFYSTVFISLLSHPVISQSCQ